jgi:signal peptidase II
VPFGEGYGEFLSGKVVDMFYFPLFEWPDWMPLVGGDVFFGAVFNVADAAISIAFVVALFFYSKYLTFNFTKSKDINEQG